jgi:hypothetical protein
MAENTAFVNEWLQKTAQLQELAIAESGKSSVDQETFSAMRMIQSASAALLTVLQRLPPVAIPQPPIPNGPPTQQGPGGTPPI